MKKTITGNSITDIIKLKLTEYKAGKFKETGEFIKYGYYFSKRKGIQIVLIRKGKIKIVIDKVLFVPNELFKNKEEFVDFVMILESNKFVNLKDIKGYSYNYDETEFCTFLNINTDDFGIQEYLLNRYSIINEKQIEILKNQYEAIGFKPIDIEEKKRLFFEYIKLNEKKDD